MQKRGYFDYRPRTDSIYEPSYGDAPFIFRQRRLGEREYATGGPLPHGEVGSYSDFSRFHHITPRDKHVSDIRRDDPYFEPVRPRVERWKTTYSDFGNWMPPGPRRRYLPVKINRQYLEREHGKVYRHSRWQNTLLRPGFVVRKNPPGKPHMLRYADHDHLEDLPVTDPCAPMWNIIQTFRVLKPTPNGR